MGTRMRLIIWIWNEIQCDSDYCIIWCHKFFIYKWVVFLFMFDYSLEINSIYATSYMHLEEWFCSWFVCVVRDISKEAGEDLRYIRVRIRVMEAGP